MSPSNAKNVWAILGLNPVMEYKYVASTGLSLSALHINSDAPVTHLHLIPAIFLTSFRAQQAQAIEDLTQLGACQRRIWP